MNNRSDRAKPSTNPDTSAEKVRGERTKKSQSEKNPAAKANDNKADPKKKSADKAYASRGSEY